jgi:alpha-amylase
MKPAVNFVFAIHIHQPVGNFDSVFQQHLADVYRPLLAHLQGAGCFPLTLHLSGPLLRWLEDHAADLIDAVGTLVADDRLELLASGYDEPILAALSREDRADQIGRMREKLRRRFGIEARGLWLTERVWEPDMAGDLADAGIEYVLLDDRHFLVSGFERAQLHAPFRTEFAGRSLGVLPIDEHLRYLVPFKPPATFAQYIETLWEEGRHLAVLADDGEKFGGWPGTKEWVYGKGWLREFLDTLARLREHGTIRLVTCAQANRVEPCGGLAYLPSASYREMEEWSLPATASTELKTLERELGGGDPLSGPKAALVRGSHWRHFLVKYQESNRMHKKTALLSRIARERSDTPSSVHQAIGRAHCNDAYWHGIFGGLYLPHLREAIWHNLAEAEGTLRIGEPLGFEVLDFDCDGNDEVWIHGENFSAIVAPARGGGIEEWTIFQTGKNALDILTRRREAYQFFDSEADLVTSTDGLASIHEVSPAFTQDALPPVDHEPRAFLLDRLLDAQTTREEFISAEYLPITTWARSPMSYSARIEDGQVVVDLAGEGNLTKRLRFSPEGHIAVEYEWIPQPGADEARFSTEITSSVPLTIITEAGADEDRWEYPVETMARSEQGFEKTVQGQATLLRWPAFLGRAAVGLRQQ